MAKYDNTGDVKRRRFPFFLTIFIIGIVPFIVGVVLIKVTNTKSLGKRYSYNETFDVAAIDNMEIDFSAGDLNIKKSSDENIHVTGENLPEKINFSSSNSKLQVKTADSLLHLKGGYISFDGSQPTLTIELPEKAFDTVKIDAATQSSFSLISISSKPSALSLSSTSSFLWSIIPETMSVPPSLINPPKIPLMPIRTSATIFAQSRS